MVKILKKTVARDPGEVGLQESDLLERMDDGEATGDSETDKVRLVSLGCYCGPKLSFKKIGRGSETLPFDWLRTRLDGVFHFMRNDFDGFYDWTTKQHANGMTIYRGYNHSFWHDNPTDPAMHERYNRRFKRFKEIDAESEVVLFVRSCSVSDELARGPELVKELKDRHGKGACLLMIIDFQHTASGAAMIAGHPDILVYYLSGAVHSDPDGAPYTEPVRVALDWAVGRPIQAMQFVDMETIVDCVDPTTWGLTGLNGVAAFEDEPCAAQSLANENILAPPAPTIPEAPAATEAPVVPAKPPPNVESDLMEMMGANVATTDDLILVSLGCFCGPKLTFQQLGRGAETLPFDWIRVSFDGLIHFMTTDFEAYFNYVTRKCVPDSHMVMYRSRYHSFWHDNPDSEEMQEKYRRRIKRFECLGDSKRPMLFVRAISSMDELARADELLKVLTTKFGDQVCLLLIADFQRQTLGAIFVEGREDIMAYFLGSQDRGSNPMAPYKRPVEIAIEWLKGEAVEAGAVSDLESLAALADSVSCNDLANFGVFEAFEPIDDSTASAESAAMSGTKRDLVSDRENSKKGGRCYTGILRLITKAFGGDGDNRNC